MPIDIFFCHGMVDRMNRILLVCACVLGTIFSAVADDYQIIHFKGKVSILRNGQILPAAKNFKLNLKDRIRTSADSLAVVKSPKLTLKVVENSEVSISDLGKEIVVDVNQGGLVANYLKQKIKDTVGTKLRVNTQHTSMGVRGTTFFVYNHKEQTSYLTVKEGSVEFKGKSSKTIETVSDNKTAFTNSDLQNTAPKKVGFEEDINWELKNFQGNLSQPKRLFSKMEEQWNNFKKENEKKWNDNNQDMNNQWDKVKDQL